ncbi:MAG: diguanylate cyclase [Clostridia bacterium]|nr:diguanylate cyclase [Clostridia bacterium]
MTSGVFEYFSSLAVISYLFMLMIFMNAKKDNLVQAFKLLLIAMSFWTGGSLLMRIQFWPSYIFWYHVSVGGMFLIMFSYFRFITAFVEVKQKKFSILYFVLLLVCFIANIPTGLIIRWPNVETVNGVSQMVYDNITGYVAILFILPAVIATHLFVLVYKRCRKDLQLRKKIAPIFLGILILFMGNLGILLPIFRGFPIDIVAGVINAAFLMFTLIKRKIFKLKLIASENVGYFPCVLLGFLGFYSLLPRLDRAFEYKENLFGSNNLLLYLISFVCIVSILFVLWKKVIANLFVKEEEHQNEILKNFSSNASKSLDLKTIFENTVSAIGKATGVQRIYISIPESENGNFIIRYSDQSLADLSFVIRRDNPIVSWIETHEEYLYMDEFVHSVAYKSMWESEKTQLSKMKITYCIGLKDNNSLIGIILFSDFGRKFKLGEQDLNTISSIGAVASIAIKNAHTYEMAFLEARTDHLTGVLNRRYFYEILQMEFSRNIDSSLALIIINIDDFKLFNQLYGVKSGDQVLERIAALIKSTVGHNCHIARYSGKEFAIILPGYDVFSAKKIAESIRDQISKINSTSNDYHQKRLTISVGISIAPYGAKSVKELVENADQAIYQVKRKGKNAIKVFDTFVQNEKDYNSEPDYMNVYDEYKSTIYALTAAIDAKDHYTFNHSDNVATYSTELAKALKLSTDTIENIRQAALLHDVGKIGIPESILNKPGKLSDDEYEIMKGHVEASIDIIRHLPSLDYVIPAVLGHHEWFNGNGYPRRIEGEDIPLTARILCVADSFDAMVSKRCYKNPVPVKEALVRLQEGEGSQFDPDLAEKFIELVESGIINVDSSD